MLEYKGYVAKIDFDNELDCFVGEIINVRDVITFQGGSAIELKKEIKRSPVKLKSLPQSIRFWFNYII